MGAIVASGIVCTYWSYARAETRKELNAIRDEGRVFQIENERLKDSLYRGELHVTLDALRKETESSSKALAAEQRNAFDALRKDTESSSKAMLAEQRDAFIAELRGLSVSIQAEELKNLDRKISERVRFSDSKVIPPGYEVEHLFYNNCSGEDKNISKWLKNNSSKIEIYGIYPSEAHYIVVYRTVANSVSR